MGLAHVCSSLPRSNPPDEPHISGGGGVRGPSGAKLGDFEGGGYAKIQMLKTLKTQVWVKICPIKVSQGVDECTQGGNYGFLMIFQVPGPDRSPGAPCSANPNPNMGQNQSD